MIEAAVGRLYTAEKKKIDGDSDARSRTSAMAALDGQQARRLATLASNREKYRDRLSEPAMIASMQPDALLENASDVFEGNGGSARRLQVYTIDPRSVAGARTDAPQWVVVSCTTP